MKTVNQLHTSQIIMHIPLLRHPSESVVQLVLDEIV